MKQFIGRAGLAALCALALSGCIDSANPILTDAQPLFGQKLRLQFYSLREGHAYEPERGNYAWNGKHYAHVSGGMRDVDAVSVYPFEAGDYIVQNQPAKRGRPAEYAIMHRLADGVFQVTAIDEADADEATRAAHCKKVDYAACRIETREQLFAFARATAARKKDNGGLVIRLSDEPERRRR